ncbi:MAG: Co/Zn/Cd efflux system rane fusion protein [Ferruginibacter sp.]|uniref:DUF3347 domain-containing protein n=1 Tax=Ferruginibacter sp. TaxID=1940288 RepID=UPI00265B20FC|nr:DUF3347 domain-containing protein [Ferruginibacter sp.]MDB5279331.1 Co/Zn/Cd efflux system rane fusion protein [Ferruginibacter sp.]
MKKVIWILVILVLAFSIYWFKFKPVETVDAAKSAPLKVMKHSPEFNRSIDTMMTAYLDLKAAFVEADSVQAKVAAQKFLLVSDSLKLDELKKDTAGIAESAAMQLNDIKANAESLLKQPNLTEMRQDFRMVSESIYPLLKTIHYEGKTLYWQNCPMAFGEGKEANWISNTAEIINPYLGKKNPEYKATMLHCGEVKDSILAQ